jgi:hypothetical protein
MVEEFSEEEAPGEGEGLKGSTLINCIYFAHYLENLNTSASYLKQL